MERQASESLHGRVVACIEAFRKGAREPESFDELASDIARFQARNVVGFGRLCASRGVDPSTFTRADQVPAVPTEAFKLSRIFAFADSEAKVVFRTSGTTIGARGTHYMRDVRTYASGARTFGRSMLAGDLELPTSVLVFGSSDESTPDSSLAFMCGEFVRAWTLCAASEQTYFVRNGTLDLDGIRSRIAAHSHGRPVTILSTSFALVHVLDALGSERMILPEGSRVMQTGGYKGKSREVDVEVLRKAVSHAFGINPRYIIGEYGMTELSSQFWEATLVDPKARHGVYMEPPWARVVPVDPETLAPVPDGAVGVARIEDLANVDSAVAVLAEDRVRRVEGGFELLGRLENAPARGCSIALDELLGDRRRRT